MYECSAVIGNTFLDRAGSLSMVRNFGHFTDSFRQWLPATVAGARGEHCTRSVVKKN
jgi:hypothetical protein